MFSAKCWWKSLARAPLTALVAFSAMAAVGTGRDGPAPLELTAAPTTLHPGETLTFGVGVGMANAPVILYVSQMGFAPIFFPVTVGSFDANGDFQFAITWPSDLYLGDVDITFVAFGIAPPDGKVAGSDYETVLFRQT